MATASGTQLAEAWPLLEERGDEWGVVRRYHNPAAGREGVAPVSAPWDFATDLDRLAVEVVIAGSWRPGELLGWVPGPAGGWLANVSYAVDAHRELHTRVPADLIRPVEG